MVSEALGTVTLAALQGSQGLPIRSDRRLTHRRRALLSRAAAAGVVFALALVGVSFAGRGQLTFTGCVANGGAHGCVAPPTDSLADTYSVAVSPDGTSVYAASFTGRDIAIFDRRADGTLSYRSCIGDPSSSSCPPTPAGSLSRVIALAVSPDGSSLYATTEGDPDATITSFHRGADGSLGFQDCLANGGAYGCRDPGPDLLGGLHGIAVSPGADTVYVASGYESAVVAFARTSDGRLTLSDCVADRGRFGCDAPRHRSLESPFGVAISPDGRSVYVGSLSGDGFSYFRRTPSGELQYQGCFANAGHHGCHAPRQPTLRSSAALEVTPDDRSLLIASESSVTRFARSASGKLRPRECFSDGRHGVGVPGGGCRQAPHPSLESGTGVVVTPDGRFAYTASLTGPSVSGGAGPLTEFALTPAGRLRYTTCYASNGRYGCRPVPKLAMVSPQDIALTSDGGSIYVASGETLAAFNRLATP
jgi:DNA-binding beta-propeller fold protein YncE